VEFDPQKHTDRDDSAEGDGTSEQIGIEILIEGKVFVVIVVVVLFLLDLLLVVVVLVVVVIIIVLVLVLISVVVLVVVVLVVVVVVVVVILAQETKGLKVTATQKIFRHTDVTATEI